MSVNNLKPGTVYVFQIRAFTAAGYGNYSPRLDVATLEEATGKHLDLWEICIFRSNKESKKLESLEAMLLKLGKKKKRNSK